MDKRRQAARTLRSDAEAALDADLGWQARMVARRITAELDAALAPAGLSSVQFGLMCLIASAPDDTLAALAQRAGLNQSTMSRNVDQLAGAGLVEVVTSESDRRRRAVWLTETGAFRLKQALACWAPANATLAARLDARAPAMLAALAATLSEADADAGAQG